MSPENPDYGRNVATERQSVGRVGRVGRGGIAAALAAVSLSLAACAGTRPSVCVDEAGCTIPPATASVRENQARVQDELEKARAALTNVTQPDPLCEEPSCPTDGGGAGGAGNSEGGGRSDGSRRESSENREATQADPRATIRIDAEGNPTEPNGWSVVRHDRNGNQVEVSYIREDTSLATTRFTVRAVPANFEVIYDPKTKKVRLAN